MAFATGVSASVAALMTAVKNFAVTHAGFTDNSATAWTSQGFTLFQLSKAGVYYTFRYNTSELFLNTATELGSTGMDTVQPGSTDYVTRTNKLDGPHVAYWLFNGGVSGVGPCVHVVVEKVANVFLHFSFGEIEKHGSFTGGQYVTGSYQKNAIGNVLTAENSPPWSAFSGNGTWESGHVRLPGGASAPFGGPAVPGRYAAACSWFSMAKETGYWRYITQWGYNDFNGRAPLMPIEMQAGSAVYTNSPPLWIPIGSVPGVVAVNLRHIEPRQVVLSEWQAFPLWEKNGSGASYVNSGNVGFAYKR